MVCHTISQEDLRVEEKLVAALLPVVGAKQSGTEEFLTPLIARACIGVMPPAPKKPSINVDNVRVCKMIGGGIGDSTVVRGIVVQRTSEGTVNLAEDAKIAVFGCGIEAGSTETKGTVSVRCRASSHPLLLLLLVLCASQCLLLLLAVVAIGCHQDGRGAQGLQQGGGAHDGGDDQVHFGRWCQGRRRRRLH
jgi:hypothetical protein